MLRKAESSRLQTLWGLALIGSCLVGCQGGSQQALDRAAIAAPPDQAAGQNPTSEHKLPVGFGWGEVPESSKRQKRSKKVKLRGSVGDEYPPGGPAIATRQDLGEAGTDNPRMRTNAKNMFNFVVDGTSSGEGDSGFNVFDSILVHEAYGACRRSAGLALSWNLRFHGRSGTVPPEPRRHRSLARSLALRSTLARPGRGRGAPQSL